MMSATPVTIAVLLLAIVTVVRLRALRAARRLVLSDQRRYDAAWEATLADPAERRAAVDLAQLVRRLQPSDQAPPRQCNTSRRRNARKRFSSGAGDYPLTEAVEPSRPLRPHKPMTAASRSWSEVWGGGEPAHDEWRPVRDLGQLLAQAAAAQPLLVRKVRQLARASDGWFLRGGSGDQMGAETFSRAGSFHALRRHLSGGVHRAGESAAEVPAPAEARGSMFVRWNEAEGSEEAEGRMQVRWTKLKSPGRAVEKMTRSYGQDCSFLVDLCRQSIYFDTVADVARCLEAVAADPEVALVRVKNRLDPSTDAAASAGFRNLALNLRLDTREAHALGVETHVCEVQLVLKAVARIKDDQGHKRYIAFRNLRGE